MSFEEQMINQYMTQMYTIICVGLVFVAVLLLLLWFWWKSRKK